MKVILLSDVKSLGKKGDLINVSDGYARNFLLPKKLATEANAAAMNELKTRQAAAAHHMDEEIKVARENAELLNNKTYKIAAKAGANGKLFGSVTAKEVAARISEETGLAIDKRKIVMEDIKAYGTFPAEVKLHAGISANISVEVTE